MKAVLFPFHFPLVWGFFWPSERRFFHLKDKRGYLCLCLIEGLICVVVTLPFQDRPLHVSICSKMGICTIWKTKCFGGIIIKVCVWVLKKPFFSVWKTRAGKVVFSVRFTLYWLFPESFNMYMWINLRMLQWTPRKHLVLILSILTCILYSFFPPTKVLTAVQVLQPLLLFHLIYF